MLSVIIIFKNNTPALSSKRGVSAEHTKSFKNGTDTLMPLDAIRDSLFSQINFPLTLMGSHRRWGWKGRNLALFGFLSHSGAIHPAFLLSSIPLVPSLVL